MKPIRLASKTIDLYFDATPAPDTPIVFLHVGEEGAGTLAAAGVRPSGPSARAVRPRVSTVFLR